MLSPYVFVSIYIAVDILYITLSRPVYNEAVKAISGSDIPSGKKGVIYAVLIAYVSMILGWLFLVVPTIKYMISTGVAKWQAGLVAGFVYAFVVYGVFNGSLYVMFNNWDVKIFTQDMVWGLSWTTLITVLFAISR
jgi:uncharacterized membrane protein